MSILQIKTDFIGQIGINPRLVRIVTNDNLSTVTSLNWLKNIEKNGFPIYKTDFIAVVYNGGAGWFNPAIDINGNITLSADVPAGAITESGSVTVGHVATFSGPTTIQDGGLLGQAAFKSVSDNTKSSVSSVSGGTVIGSLATFADTTGTVTQNTANFRAQTSSFGGGSSTATITDINCTTSSIVFCQIQSSTNAVNIQKVTPNAGSITILMSGDPGASTIFNYVIIKQQ